MKKLILDKLNILKRPFYSLLVSPFKRIIGIVGDESESTTSNLQASINRLNQDAEQPKTFNCDAYILANQRMHEIETQKAMLVSLSRHDRWKAGGPL